MDKLIAHLGTTRGGADELLQALGTGTARKLSRRDFLRATGLAGGGLMLAIGLPEDGGILGRVAQAQEKPRFVYPPAAFIRIGADDTVTVLVNKLEFGQGVFTSLPMLIAEELDCDWTKVRAEHAPAAQVYAHTQFGIQMTGGSTSISSSWQQFRVIGATARDMLITAAAQQWKADKAKLDTRNGSVTEMGGQKRRATFGSLAEAAMKLPVPEKASIKADAADFRFIGRPTRRIDSRDKVTGKATFGIDVQVPGMLTAVIAHPPVFGGKVKSSQMVEPAPKGFKSMVIIPTDRGGTGVAFVAETFWPARQARETAKIDWDLPAGPSTPALFTQFRELAQKDGLPARRDGSADAIKSAARTLQADFEFPYLAHASMEPLNAVIDLKADRMTIWCGSQFQTVDQILAAQAAGLKPEQVELNTTFAGGGFGRRANPAADYLVEAVHVARKLREGGIEAPVKVVWTREDDTRAGYYRPMHVHRVSVGVDGKGQPTAWQHTIVGQSILKGTAFEKFLVKDGIDATITEGVTDTPYRLPNMQVSVHHPEVDVPVLWWRSVGHSHTAFVMETLIDELAAAAKQDPIAYRLALIDARHTRHRAVLNLVRERSGWGKPLPKGRARGIAVHESFGSVCAQVAEVSVQDKTIRVHKVTAAFDCGTAVNPLGVEAQIQSALVFGLSAALYGNISLKDGRVEQGNFHDYPVLRINEMPEVAVFVVPSNARPTGAGEPGTPPIAPAVANAVFALTGKRLRKLPFDLGAA